MLSGVEIETLENKYLKKFYHFLKYSEDEMLKWFNTKEEIKEDWFWLYSSGISDFAVGAERIVYALFNWKGIWQPNSCPVGADLFFEVEDAFIHIDLKTVQTENIGDCTSNIFVGLNQNSYKSEIKKANGQSFDPIRYYTPSLPTFYNKWKSNEKICLSYFVIILYERANLNILKISIACMPNWALVNHYWTRALQAWKNPDKTRFRFTEMPTFELLENTPKRVKVVYFDENMNTTHKGKLVFYHNIYTENKD